MKTAPRKIAAQKVMKVGPGTRRHWIGLGVEHAR